MHLVLCKMVLVDNFLHIFYIEFYWFGAVIFDLVHNTNTIVNLHLLLTGSVNLY